MLTITFRPRIVQSVRLTTSMTTKRERGEFEMVWDIKWENAACRNSDPELFFPVAEESTFLGQRQRNEAKTVCVECPLRTDCLEWALAKGLDDGVWGGYTEGERRKLRRDALYPPRQQSA